LSILHWADPVEDTIEQIYSIWPKMPLELVMEEPLTVVATGKDPLKGWVQFAGSIRLF